MKLISIKILFLFFFFWIFISCDYGLSDVVIPPQSENSELLNSTPLPLTAQKSIEGIYKITKGGGDFGKELVLKFTNNKLTIFTGKNAAYMLLDAGYKNSTIYFEGYWRFSQTSDIGKIYLKMKCNEGACDLINGKSSASITISGTYDGRPNNQDGGISFEKVKDLQPINNYWIISHRGGGRNVDRLPASENTCEIIRLAERLGSNGIEVDVRLTKDSVPVLFHDENLSLRTINEDFFIGQISDYTFAQLRTFCTLKNGERIPTLSEALETVVNETELKLVWLDIKNAASIIQVAKIQDEFLDLAKSKGRNLEILIGIPDEIIMNEFLKLDKYKEHPCLCEIGIKESEKLNAKVWAPRWSLGIQTQEVQQAHEAGRRAFIWTLDVQKFINTFIYESDFDGILTNYPSIVMFSYYVKN